MPLPTMSVRVAPEHQTLIRDIAAALRTRPELIDVLRNVLQSKHDYTVSITDGNTDALQPILDRLDALEEREPRMVRIEALEARLAQAEEWMERLTSMSIAVSRRVDALERGTGSPTAPPQQPRPAVMAGEKRKPTQITDDTRRQMHDLRALGMTQRGIAEKLDISNGAVSKYLALPRPPD